MSLIGARVNAFGLVEEGLVGDPGRPARMDCGQFPTYAAKTMYEKVIPVLEQAIQEIFATLAYEQDVDAEDVRKMAIQHDHFKKFVTSYIDRSIEMHIGFQVDMYGDEASKEEFQAKFRFREGGQTSEP